MMESADPIQEALHAVRAGPNVADVLDHWCRRQPDAVALQFPDHTVSFAELASRSGQVARRLKHAGVAEGSRVGLLELNTPAYFYLFFALARLGSVLVPINFRLAPAEIDFIAADAELKLLFVGPAFDPMVPALGSLDPASIIRLATRSTSQKWFGSWGRATSIVSAAAESDLVQLYTSGTTGNPKGVVTDHSRYLGFIEAVIKAGWGAYSPGHKQLVAMPMFHVAGLNMAMLVTLQGGTNVVLPAVDPEAILKTLDAEKIRSTLMAPAVLQMMVQHPLARLLSFDHLDEVLYGASPISEALQAKVAETFDCKLVQLYGMTENLGGGTYLGTAEHAPERGLLRSCGKAYEGSELIIVDGDGKPVPTGEVGEVLTRSAWTMKAYWNRPEETREALEGGWLHTGDAAYMDEDGYVFIFDRLKDMIVTGGENVYPAEVENALAGYPGVRQVAVIGVPDETWGEAVKAVLVMDEGEELDPAAINDYASQKLAKFKLPKSYELAQALPMNATGKILKKELRKKYWSDKDRQVG
jgi:acyl-CoA synthetase (AMP-forming)/AMP-acid ligase II